MLASTVKFSRCRRQTARRLWGRRYPIRWRLGAHATETSGPNSVLGLHQPSRRVSTPDKQEVLTTKSAEWAYWSMFHIPVPARFQSNAGKSSEWTDRSDLPSGSLERR